MARAHRPLGAGAGLLLLPLAHHGEPGIDPADLMRRPWAHRRIQAALVPLADLRRMVLPSALAAAWSAPPESCRSMEVLSCHGIQGAAVQHQA
jgi:hypothetical protein